MQQQTNSDSSRRALVLIVDPKAESRHWMWRLLSKAFGVLEAPNAINAKKWIAERPDIDALIIEDELPDLRGSDLVKELAKSAHPIAEHSIVMASEWRRVMLGGMTVVERGDIQTILLKLTGWFTTGDVEQARRLLQAFAGPASTRGSRPS